MTDLASQGITPLSSLVGREVRRLQLVSYTALKTLHPAPAVLAGRTIDAVTQDSGTIAITLGDVVVRVGLGRSGAAHWRDSAPTILGCGGTRSIVARLVLDDGAGIDVVETDVVDTVRITIESV